MLTLLDFDRQVSRFSFFSLPYKTKCSLSGLLNISNKTLHEQALDNLLVLKIAKRILGSCHGWSPNFVSAGQNNTIQIKRQRKFSNLTALKKQEKPQNQQKKVNQKKPT